MLPAGFPWIVRDGIEALRWRATLQARALGWLERRLEDEAPSEDPARRHADDTKALAQRLAWLPDQMWEDGSARDYVTIVDLALLDHASRPHDALLPAILGVAPEDVELHRREILALRKWLTRYLAAGG